jgi:hypothetical protein
MDFAANPAAKAANDPAGGGAAPANSLQMQARLRRPSTGLWIEILGLFLVLVDDLHQFFAQRRVLLAIGQGAELRSVFPVVRRSLARRLHLPPAVPDIGFP